jgi:HAE1 family hydrophobic/amphiphilic exporter-1
VAGEEVSKFKDSDEQYSVVLRVSAGDRDRPEKISNLWIPSNRLGQVQLSNFASREKNIGPTTIERQARERQVTLVANTENNVGIGDAVNLLGARLGAVQMKAGYTAEFTGRAKTLNELQQSFILAFLFSAIFMYMVLAAQFESYLHPITIMLFAAAQCSIRLVFPLGRSLAPGSVQRSRHFVVVWNCEEELNSSNRLHEYAAGPRDVETGGHY